MVTQPPIAPQNQLDINIGGNNYTGFVEGYSSQDKPNSTVSNRDTGIGGIRLDGNGWKSLSIGDYNVTANTVIEFEFQSDSQGEVQGIGFDNDNNNSNSAHQIFQLWGTQVYGVQDYNNQNYQLIDGWKRYSINIGAYFTGNINRLTFINDDDRITPLGVSLFRNIILREN